MYVYERHKCVSEIIYISRLKQESKNIHEQNAKVRPTVRKPLNRLHSRNDMHLLEISFKTASLPTQFAQFCYKKYNCCWQRERILCFIIHLMNCNCNCN